MSFKGFRGGAEGIPNLGLRTPDLPVCSLVLACVQYCVGLLEWFLACAVARRGLLGSRIQYSGCRVLLSNVERGKDVGALGKEVRHSEGA